MVHGSLAGWMTLALALPGCFAPVGNGQPVSSGTTDASTTTTEPTPTTDEPTPTTGDPTTTTTTTEPLPTTSSTGEPGDPCLDQPQISADELQARVFADFADPAVSAEALPYTRYFSLVHLHNAGLCDDQIEVHRQALTKLTNSLSQIDTITLPVAIDAERLLYRIDLRDYGWHNMGASFTLSEPSHYFPDPGEATKPYPDRWELLADQSPTLVVHTGELATKIAATTVTSAPILRGDAFVDAASRAPLYYDMLGLATTQDKLASQLGLDLAGAVMTERTSDTGQVARAGLHGSPLTGKVRAIERQNLIQNPNHGFWRSFDFGASDGFGDVFTDPFTFIADGSELLFNLPNGLQAYAIVDGGGLRKNSVPLDVFAFAALPGSEAIAGVACIGCHTHGVHPAIDDLRHEIDNGTNAIPYTDPVAQEIRNLHPPRPAFAELVDNDQGRFSFALDKLGLSPADDEPVLTSFLAFDQPIDVRRAAAELELPSEADFNFFLGMLSADLVDLKDGGTVDRETFTYHFAASVCILHTGLTRCCPDGTLLAECQP